MLFVSIKNFLVLWFKVITTPPVRYIDEYSEEITMNGNGDIVDRRTK